MKKIKEDEFLDCTGLYCPAPIFELRKKIDSISKESILKIIADDPAAEEDFKHWAKTTGNKLLDYYKEKGRFVFFIKKS
ncbi:MAG: sulfurtransferase TusA family protein [Actinobacteria bacterium]|nr:sulfurtransferase TusA family protein [Actinomycetota bacterium]MBM3712854.1 sulfurtransferase TusA family protein [Actinomycetota bacterium]